MRLIGLLLAPLLLTGCLGGGMDDLEEWVKNSGADMRGKIPPAPEVKPYDVFLYQNDGNPAKNELPLPDPFKPRNPPKVNKAELTGEDHVKEPLENFPLESLKMIGFLEQKNVSYAIIRAPDNHITRVKVGNYLGMNFGRIISINNVEITIKELVRDSVGDANERTSTLQLEELGAK